MRSYSLFGAVAAVGLTAALVACSSDTGSPAGDGGSDAGGAGASGGHAGTSPARGGAAGISGTSGTSGAGGHSGQLGVGGTEAGGTSAGETGIAGTSGAGDSAGTAGTAGTTGTGGAGGAAGMSGAGGAAGMSGIAGMIGAGGAAGMSGTAGTSGAGASGTSGAAGVGGVGGTSGAGGGVAASPALQLSTTQLFFFGMPCGGSAGVPLTFTIKNTSAAPVTWSSTLTQSPSFTFFSIAPSGSTLAPGDTITVTATPLAIPSGSIAATELPLLHGDITISGDPAGTNSITVSESVQGPGFVWQPTTLDFGAVPIGGVKTLPLTVALYGTNNAPELGSNNNLFNPSVFNGTHPTQWSVTFSPTAPGSQTATISWISQSFLGGVCSTNQFTATGIGSVVGNTGCQVAMTGTPCGDGEVCGPPGLCLTELTLAAAPISFTPGALFSGTIATGTDALRNASSLAASVDWGDSTTSAGTVALAQDYVGRTLPLTVTGAHTYANAGTYNGTVTLSDSVTTFTSTATFTASN